jgi:hypothetical protein
LYEVAYAILPTQGISKCDLCIATLERGFNALLLTLLRRLFGAIHRWKGALKTQLS